MPLQCNLKQGVQFRCDLHNKVLGKSHELTHLPGALMQCLQLQQDVALQPLQWLQAAVLASYRHLSLWLVWVSLLEQDGYAMARYSGLHP